MKVIAIMGSPHKGNGYNIVRKIESELKLITDIEFQYIFLKDANIKMCKGCFACIAKGEESCPINDDREQIEQDLLQADGIILNSPGYTWNVTGLMKNFMDRFAYSLHRPKFFQQSLMLVANGGSGLNGTLQALSKTLGGSKIACELGITATPWESTQSYVDKTEKNIRKCARRFYKSMIDKKDQSPKLGNLIWFHIFKKMASISKETLPADYHYYSNHDKYFYETKVNPVKSIIASIIAKIGVWSLAKRIHFR